jgi:hypothetical protein
VVIGRAAHQATGFDKDALNRSMKMSVPTMGPTTDFKQWKRSFLNFLSIKATYLIPQLAIRDSSVWLDEPAQHYAYTVLLHAASANQRAGQAMKCVSPARLDCAAAAWDIMCERLDSRSFARSLSLLDNLMFKKRPGQSLSDYVYYMRQTFDDYNETCQMVDGSAAIHPHSLGLLMLRGISNTGPHGQAKPCVINAFDTNHIIGRLLIVSLMQTHSGCEFIFPFDSDTGVLVVPTGMGVLEPSGNGLYLLPHQPRLPSTPSATTMNDPSPIVALVAQCDLVLWHRRFGHMNMQSLQAQHTHGVPTSHALASAVENISCDSCLLHKATVAPRNINACAKPSRPLLNL